MFGFFILGVVCSKGGVPTSDGRSRDSGHLALAAGCARSFAEGSSEIFLLIINSETNFPYIVCRI